MKKVYLIVLTATMQAACFGQSYFVTNKHKSSKYPVIIHSHNDYRQNVPFFQAYSQNAESIETDLYLSKNGDLLVAHDRDELPTAPTVDSLYINRIVEMFKGNGNRAWKNSNQILQLLVDPKEQGVEIVDILLKKISKYPNVFNSKVNPFAVRVVITGQRPEKENFAKYPAEYLSFDGRISETYTEDQLKRIAIFSASIKDYSNWNGKGIFIADQRKAVEDVIKTAHDQGKKIRFYSTSDCPNCWLTLYEMGVDIINTDNPEACTIFFSEFNKKSFTLADKNTFKTYVPTYKNDGADKPIKNVILIIGDGMSISQITATDAVNNGLTLLNFKNIGFQKTSAADSYVTDSAGAGSSIATGVKNNNRHISSSPTGEPYPSMLDYMYERGYKCGVVSNGDITDATPAAFYAHNTERDNSEEIAMDLLENRVTVLAGSNLSPFIKRKDGVNLFNKLKEKGFNITRTIDSIAKFSTGKVICIDEKMGEYAKPNNLNLLANSTINTIEALNKDNKKGFFLMVEAAKIDYSGHGNDIRGNVVETLSLDKAIEAAVRFADSNGETLIIVTGDHETGGLSIIGGDKETRKITGLYASNDHTGIMLPVFAYGPGSQNFRGVYENTNFFKQLKTLIK